MNLDSVFLGRVGHDFRGELATIVAGVHYLLRYEKNLSPTAHQMCERVNGAGQRLRHLLDEFDHAAWMLDADSSALRREPTHPGDVVATALEKAAPMLETREVTVAREIVAPLPLVDLDPQVFALALEHLLDFASARSEKGSVRIVVEAKGEKVRLTIVDSGPALEASAFETIFDRFALRDLIPRGEPGQKRRERLGLGLAIARGVVAAHGGTLVAEPDEGGGVAMRVELPARAAQALDRAG